MIVGRDYANEASRQAKLAALRSEAVELNEEEERLLGLLQEVRHRQERTKDSILRTERGWGVHDRRVVPQESWRRTVRELGTFTVSELATELAVSQATAKKRIDELKEAGIVRDAGRLGGKHLYEYAKPEEAGAEYEAQRRLRVVAPPPEVAVVAQVARGQEVRQSRIGSVPDKMMREVAREAIGAGWTLSSGGGKHAFRLVRETESVTLPTSPRNPGSAADDLRRRLGLRRARANAS